MSASSLSRYLKDFSAPAIDIQVGASSSYFSDLDMPDVSLLPSPAQPKIDIDAERLQARRDGRAEAEEELSERHAAEIAALEARHQEALEALRATLEAEAAQRIAERFKEMSAAIVEHLGGEAARALAPVLQDALARKAVADLGRALRRSLAEGEACRIVVTGPAKLYAALKAELGDTAEASFRHVEADDIDLSVDMGGPILVTRMSAFAKAVEKVLA
ncbi:hypothetical protein BJF92_16970 [Rhizobium rhizosphaerae]|uniref:Uncharacterized protein n=1 Tax=Xaviernesmea rhizosphaerae TaxID=1672749 RepID=A0A1Q9AIP7_9HYPH|nr:hypothetical protein [Xaviernesmea rhizosphaerae]OLP55087.1 hypothetical protein BJF92_16970 [Xaviernesmea rhizosphaerae]